MGAGRWFFVAAICLASAGMVSATSLRLLAMDGAIGKRGIETDRPGKATATHSCGTVGAVPAQLRLAANMAPAGLSNFYQKYTEAYGIPILGSAKVPDAALKRVCYIVRFVLADREDVRQSVYARYGRFALIGQQEQTTDIPEHANLEPKSFYNSRRGLGATIVAPATTSGEENALCYRTDPYWSEDIGIHEIAHALHLLGLVYAIPDFDSRLKAAYDQAKQKGLWKDTYAATNHIEYWAEGVQSYFSVNDYRNPTNGIHNHVSTNSALQSYDRVFFDLIKEVFACGNQFIPRCPGATETADAVRGKEAAQVLRMNCATSPSVSAGCKDNSIHCPGWAQSGECTKNPQYMLTNCVKSCNTCASGCADNNVSCPGWASTGECAKNPGYMNVNCKKSCKLC